MIDKILCPWCGAEMFHPRPWQKSTPDMGGYNWTVQAKCRECGAFSPKVYGRTRQEAENKLFVTALRRYTPQIKPMTLEEVKEVKAVWIEDPEQEYESKLYPAIYWGVGNGSYSVFVADIDDGEERAWYHNEEYGTWWRCWSRKPTDEERSAAEWETSRGK